jgi:hypothetical protein
LIRLSPPPKPSITPLRLLPGRALGDPVSLRPSLRQLEKLKKELLKEAG